jgi:hypothetical protein
MARLLSNRHLYNSHGKRTTKERSYDRPNALGISARNDKPRDDQFNQADGGVQDKARIPERRETTPGQSSDT